MKPASLIILLVLNFFWAASLSAYKVLGANLSVGGIVTLRFGIAGLSLLLLWPWLPGIAPRGRDLLVTCGMGLIVFTLGHRLQVYGNSLSLASNTSVLTAIEPLLAGIAAALFLREHIGPRRMVGFAFGLLGVVLLNGVWRADFHWVGLGASLIFMSSFICEAAFSIVGKPLIARAGPVKVVALSLLVGTAANLMIDGRQTLAAAVALPGPQWALVLTLAWVCTAFGYAFWFLVIREGEVSVAVLTIYAQPVFGVLLARVWLGEQLHWGQFWGSCAIVIGLLIGLSRQIQRPPRSVVGKTSR
ncbi:MAG: DMT family transporter [Verrucomicrobia subdivision 3 bacterium]|nr:DMT family transporter [Verrucomicrobiota bacterium]MCC6821906.1 DMT family transporter [Limisphaerales bacterium]